MSKISYFKKTAKVLDYINEKTVLVIQNTELLGQQLDKLFDKANGFEKLSKDIQHAKPEELFLNRVLNERLIFSVIELHTERCF